VLEIKTVARVTLRGKKESIHFSHADKKFSHAAPSGMAARARAKFWFWFL
jgi:hypothetical protein